MADLVQCRSPFAVNVDGARLIVSSGDIYSADDPIVKGREALFTEVSVKTSRPRSTTAASITGGAGETADAPPSARRRLTRPKDEMAVTQPEKNEV